MFLVVCLLAHSLAFLLRQPLSHLGSLRGCVLAISQRGHRTDKPKPPVCWWLSMAAAACCQGRPEVGKEIYHTGAGRPAVAATALNPLLDSMSGSWAAPDAVAADVADGAATGDLLETADRDLPAALHAAQRSALLAALHGQPPVQGNRLQVKSAPISTAPPATMHAHAGMGTQRHAACSSRGLDRQPAAPPAADAAMVASPYSFTGKGAAPAAARSTFSSLSLLHTAQAAYTHLAAVAALHPASAFDAHLSAVLEHAAPVLKPMRLLSTVISSSALGDPAAYALQVGFDVCLSLCAVTAREPIICTVGPATMVTQACNDVTCALDTEALTWPLTSAPTGKGAAAVAPTH